MELIGILVIIVGFALKLDTIAVVVTAGLTTGLVAHMSIGDILRHATDIRETEGKLTFTNDAYNIDEGSFAIDTSTSGITGAGYLMCTSKLDGTSKGLLVATRGIYVRNMYVTDFQLSYDKEKHVFTGSYVIVSKMTDRTKTCEFSYRTIADVKKQQNGE